MHTRRYRSARKRSRTAGSNLSFEALEQRLPMHHGAASEFDVLVFSHTTGFRHDSIGTGIEVIEELGRANNFHVTPLEDPAIFSDEGLSEFEAVVFLNTTGDVLDESQQGALERYIQSGGGFVGIHSAADTEHQWPWYGQLVGAYFASHPPVQTATVEIIDSVHPSTTTLPERWEIREEWYNYHINPRGNVHVLATLDQSTLEGGTMGFDHPIAWAHEFDGGRSWYSGLGHHAQTYHLPEMQQHLLGGIQWAAGRQLGDVGATIDSNYRKVMLEQDTDDPMQMDIAADGRVFFAERGGAVRVYDPTMASTQTLGQITVTEAGEDGLLGLALDPDFSLNGQIYLFYSPPEVTENRVSRFTLVNDQLDLSSEQILLRIPAMHECCHSGGGLEFGPDGLLYVGVGDSSNPFASDGYTPIDERPGRERWDAQRSSANTHDLRGKILRIRPMEDGTYSIPDGNLFLADGTNGRPEIYAMGNRNPFRFSIDSETGWLYWGDVGPDADAASPNRGPAGHDEFNQARAAGNFGWPYFVGDNQPYVDYDFATSVAGSPFDPDSPTNQSPNNTGAANLPPSQPAWIWYDSEVSPFFPELGRGSRTAMAGPVYHFDASLQSEVKLPEYYDNTLFIYEWSRRWIKEVKLDADGQILAINPFLPSMQFERPIDMEIGPDGALYMLEWGLGFRGGNPDSELIRIEYLNQPEPVDEFLPGDANLDGRVDFDDFVALANHFAQPSGATWSQGDFDGDADVDFDDFVILSENFGRSLEG